MAIATISAIILDATKAEIGPWIHRKIHHLKLGFQSQSFLDTDVKSIRGPVGRTPSM